MLKVIICKHYMLFLS